MPENVSYYTIFRPRNTVFINRTLYEKMLSDREKYTPELIGDFLMGRLRKGDAPVSDFEFPLAMADYGIASNAQVNGCCDIKWDLLLKLPPKDFAKQISIIARRIEKAYPFITKKLREISIQLQEEEDKNGHQF